MIGIIFDCDGTLISSEQMHFLSWQTPLSKRGYALKIEEYFTYAGQSGAYISQKFHEKVGMGTAQAILEEKRKAYLELQNQKISPIERTIRFLQKLAQNKEKWGIKLGVASAASKDEIIINLKHLGLLDVFDVIVSGKDDLFHYSDPDGVNKPKPYIYMHAAKCLGLDPSQCVAFEDSHPGVQSAVDAGLLTFAVPNYFTKKHDFSKAHFVIQENQEIEIEDFFQKVKKYALWNHQTP